MHIFHRLNRPPYGVRARCLFVFPFRIRHLHPRACTALCAVDSGKKGQSRTIGHTCILYVALSIGRNRERGDTVSIEVGRIERDERAFLNSASRVALFPFGSSPFCPPRMGDATERNNAMRIRAKKNKFFAAVAIDMCTSLSFHVLWKKTRCDYANAPFSNTCARDSLFTGLVIGIIFFSLIVSLHLSLRGSRTVLLLSVARVNPFTGEPFRRGNPFAHCCPVSANPFCLAGDG